MNLAMDQDQENHDTQNIVPLGSDEIRSILKSQSESAFEDKNISNNEVHNTFVNCSNYLYFKIFLEMNKHIFALTLVSFICN